MRYLKGEKSIDVPRTRLFFHAEDFEEKMSGLPRQLGFFLHRSDLFISMNGVLSLNCVIINLGILAFLILSKE